MQHDQLTVTQPFEKRLLIIVVSGLLFFSVIIGLLIFNSIYQEKITEAKMRESELVNTSSLEAAVGVFANNEVIIRDVANGLLKSSLVTGVRISSAEKVLATHKEETGDFVSAATYPLYSPTDPNIVIGKIEIERNQKQLKTQSKNDALRYAFIAVFQTLFVAFLLILFFKIKLLQPISSLARQISQIKPGSNQRLANRKETGTEIDVLTRGSNMLLQSVEDAVTQVQKANEAKSAFLANMSHELRTPMHSITSFTALALKKVQDEKTAHFLENIQVSSQRLTGLLNALLDLSKLESGTVDMHYAPASLTDIVRQSISQVHSLLQDKQLTLQFDDSTNMEGIFDSGQITQVVINLLSNAIKFSPAGGTIQIIINDIETTNEKGFKGVLEFIIIDQGTGIPADELKAVFDKYVQSSKIKSEHGGTGLGLPICREIINRHDGLIWAESPLTNQDRGTAFHFIIPKTQEITKN